VSEKTSTPDEQPDHREPHRDDADRGATVATDEQVTADGTTADGDRPDDAADADPGARPAEEAGAAVPVPASAVPVTEDEQTVVDVPVSPPDAPTAQMRVPASDNGTAHGNGTGYVPVAGPVTGPPMPSRPTGGPIPAPGPVPGPGPDAATPPPWRRIPGQNGAEQRGVPVRVSAPAEGLLDEEPTEFLRAPEPERTAGPGRAPVRAARNRPPRQAALQLRRLDPWSVLKLALVLAVVLFFVWLVAVGVLYGVLDGIGVWDRLNGTYADLVSGEAQTGSPLISAGRVFGFAALVGAINSLLFAVAVTIAAFVYNVSADLVGGIEVTLSERD
jgi:hypothetical protein